MNKELIEAIKIRYGWTDESVLSITAEDILKMTKEELDDYIKISTAIYDATEEENFAIQELPVINGAVIVSEEDQDDHK